MRSDKNNFNITKNLCYFLVGRVEGVNELAGERKLPFLAKEGCGEAAGWFDREIDYWTNTTPALHSSLVCQFIHIFYHRTVHKSCAVTDRAYKE